MASASPPMKWSYPYHAGGPLLRPLQLKASGSLRGWWWVGYRVSPVSPLLRERDKRQKRVYPALPPAASPFWAEEREPPHQPRRPHSSFSAASLPLSSFSQNHPRLHQDPGNTCSFSYLHAAPDVPAGNLTGTHRCGRALTPQASCWINTTLLGCILWSWELAVHTQERLGREPVVLEAVLGWR